MSPYHKALIEEMTLRNLSRRTIDSYVQAMAQFCQFIGKTPNRIRAADVRMFLVHLITVKGHAYSSVRQARHALKYYYVHIKKTPEVVGGLPPMKKEFRLSEVLGQEELFRLLHAPNLNVRNLALLRLAYGGGLRVSELISLRILDIQPEAFEAFIEQPAEKEWVVYSKPSLTGPEHAFGYLSRYTHRIVISNSRILELDESSVTSLTSTAKTMENRRQRLLSRRNFSGDS